MHNHFSNRSVHHRTPFRHLLSINNSPDHTKLLSVVLVGEYALTLNDSMQTSPPFWFQSLEQRQGVSSTPPAMRIY